MAQYRKRILVVSLAVAGAVTALAAAMLYMNFHPKRSYEIPGAGRLFAQAIDSADETIHVQVADWPHTFWKPFFLGDAEWRERYIVSQFYRSKDGSVVAFLAQERSEARPSYVAAYDFKAHEKIQLEKIEGGVSACNERIAELLTQRGGREETPLEIPSLNSGLYQR